MSEPILKLEEVLQGKTDSPQKKKKVKVKKTSDTLEIPRGAPKSGRTWKTPKKRFSSIIKTRGHKIANKFEKLQILKKDLARVKDLTKSIVEQRQQEIEMKKERRRKNLKRREENGLKAEVVQVIKNTAKLKRMKKKQLRSIQKRDTLKK